MHTDGGAEGCGCGEVVVILLVVVIIKLSKK